MKKLIAMLVLVLLLPISTQAMAIDLSSMSYDELVTLHKETFKAIMALPEFKEVDVPSGSYMVGEHIPAGEYKITTKISMASVTINEYEQLFVVTPDMPVGRLILKNGDKVAISTGVVFSPYVGLGF